MPGILKSWLHGIYFHFVTFTRIGFGDIIGPAAVIHFYELDLFFGLSIISGVVDSFVNLTEYVEIGVTCKGFSWRYIEGNKGEVRDAQEEQAIDDTAI